MKDSWERSRSSWSASARRRRINLHLYLPDGVYRVSGPVFYRGEIAADRGERPGVEKPQQRFDILRVRIVGQSRGKTILRLDDRASGFGDPSRPQVVLAYQHLDATRKDIVGDKVWRRLADGTMVGFNNGVGHNLLRNLTIETGRGNPGAIGLFFQGANIADLRNVTIRSGDGAGVCGLWMPIGSVHRQLDGLRRHCRGSPLGEENHGSEKPPATQAEPRKSAFRAAVRELFDGEMRHRGHYVSTRLSESLQHPRSN
jgi:hypothetical protein